MEYKTTKELKDLYDDLEKNAYDINYHTYYCKYANQIIRKHFERLQQQDSTKPEVEPEVAGKKVLYKVTLAYGYNYGKRFCFIVVATGIEPAIELATKTFNGYKYGTCMLNQVEIIASEGQYSKPEILLIAE